MVEIPTLDAQVRPLDIAAWVAAEKKHAA